jgi:hypothetical protein
MKFLTPFEIVALDPVKFESVEESINKHEELQIKNIPILSKAVSNFV